MTKEQCSIVDLMQNTPEWLEYRRTKIGASDAPVIMGVSPYKKVQVLFNEKLTGVSHTVIHNGITAGKELEPIALGLLNRQLGTDLQPYVVQSIEHPYLIASLDGYDPITKTACEIKVPCESDHHLAAMGHVPAKYYPQLQHQMLVSGLDKIVYCSYRDLDIITVIVPVDLDYQKDLLEKEKLFYKSLCDGFLDESFIPMIIDNPTIDVLFAELQALREEKKRLLAPIEEKEESLKNAIVSLADNMQMNTQTCSIKRMTRTSYDYKQMAKDYNITINNYKKESTYWDIRERKA